MSTEQLIPLIVIAVVLPLVLLRNRRPRTLRPQWMWVTPVIVAALIGSGLWASAKYGDPAQADFNAASWAILAVGLILGAVAGWWRGKMVVIHKEADGVLKAQASPLGLVLIIALLLSRQALRPWMETHSGDWHVSPLAIQDGFMLFAIGLIVAQRVEMFIRARRIQAGGTDSHLEIDA